MTLVDLKPYVHGLGIKVINGPPSLSPLCTGIKEAENLILVQQDALSPQ